MAQVEQYIIDQQPRHHPSTDENHPALSSVPSAPGPELDPKHYHHRKQDLPEPPLFSPPVTSTTFDDLSFDHRENLSVGSIHSHSSPADPTDKSTEDHSGSNNEPRTPESVAPSLDYIPFITGDSDALSVDHFDQAPEIISKAQIPQANGAQEQSEETSQHVDEPSPASTSEEPAVSEADSQRKPVENEPKSIESSAEEKENSKIDSQQGAHSLPKEEPRSKTGDTVKNTAPMSVDDWLDISRPEVQFAIGLFAVPWASLVIFCRSMNLAWTLIFAQPLVQPVAGVLPSIIAPSVLYASLVALFISSAAEINW